jgi:hypothetical protein|tara:strand:+ start:178 stop:588 length:411 start_codon:yes stop_codon:yes gene_type:complete
MSYTNRNSNRNRSSKENDKLKQLEKRARNDPEVHAQLVTIMEEDPELINTFTNYVERKYTHKWNNLSSDEKNALIKKEINNSRIPNKTKGGKTKGGKKKYNIKSHTKRRNAKRGNKTKCRKTSRRVKTSKRGKSSK